MTTSNITRPSDFSNVGYLQEVFFVLEKQLVNIPYVIDTFGKEVKIDETLDILIESGIDLLTMYFTPRSESFTEVSQLTKNGKVYNQKLVLDIPSTSLENAATIQAIGNNKVFLYFRDRNGKFKFLRNMLMTSQLELSEAHRTRLTFEFQSKLPAKFIDIASAVNITNATVGTDALCSYEHSARKGKLLKVEDFPLLWINDYVDDFKGNTFKIEGNGCVYSGGVSDYAAVISIDLNNKSLTTNFTDVMLSKFVSLTELVCAENSIIVLNVANLTSLTSLICFSNPISTLNISNLTSLTFLACANNSISTLDVSNLTFLNHLSCAVNSISILDVSSLTSLTYLHCHTNSISTLDVSNLTSLTLLACASNSINILDVSSLTSLTFLNCARNSISILNVANLTSLTSLNCATNLINVLNVSNLTSLVTLICFSNSISTLDVSNLTSLTYLACHLNQITNTINSQILVDLDNNGNSNGFFQSSITGGGSLTTAGSAAKTSLQAKGWNIVGI